MYQWFVKRGRISIERQGDLIFIDIDGEGAESCLLTPLDAKEITDIVTSLSQTIWESQTEYSNYSQQYFTTDNKQFLWRNSENELLLDLYSNAPAIELALTGPSPFKMNVNQSVELIQIVQQHLG